MSIRLSGRVECSGGRSGGGIGIGIGTDIEIDRAILALISRAEEQSKSYRAEGLGGRVCEGSLHHLCTHVYSIGRIWWVSHSVSLASGIATRVVGGIADESLAG